MANNTIEKLIKDLPAELQAKARDCKSVDDLNRFAAENNIELSDDILEGVSGGCGGGSKKTKVKVCNVCNTTTTSEFPPRLPRPAGSKLFCPKCYKALMDSEVHEEER